MEYRTFGRLNWKVSEIGHGMWGMGGQWKGSTDAEAIAALQKSYELGCNFYDTAWIYGQGHSENLFRDSLAQYQRQGKIILATKVPPKNLKWPAKAEYDIKESFPKEHIIEYAHKSLVNLGIDQIDLLQLHTWDDSWTMSDEWKMAAAELKAQGVIKGFGISINKWEANNALQAIKTGLIDSVQVVYNIFTQEAQDALFAECKARNIAVIVRVPFDEGSLSGGITRDTVFAADDWRASYFTKENIKETMDRVDEIREVDLRGMSLAEVALRFILAESAVSTIIPGMRNTKHVESNLAVSDGKVLDQDLVDIFKQFRWDREPS
jgi:aryl-alcohol dehydrogenase-like predicted oxidoreductase